MKWRTFGILLAIAAASALWSDLARFYSHRAEKQYRSGRYAEAIRDWKSELTLRSDDSLARFNKGVASYRLGEFSAALEDFAHVARSGDSVLRYQALFNQGNSLARLADQSGSGQRAAAERLYRAAFDCYGEALKIRPGEQDAVANQAVVAAAMAALRNAQGLHGADRKSGERAGTGSTARDRTPDGPPGPDKAAAVEGKNGKPDSTLPESGVSRKSMGREQAERLLNEKRGQEVLPSSIKAAPGGAKSVPPVKDW